MIADGEKLVGKYLRDVAGLRIVGKTPTVISSPWVRLTLLDAPQAEGSTADHLVAFYFQLDCYAGVTGGQPEATGQALAARAAIVDIPNHVHDLGVVTASRINGQTRVPDEQLDARDRVILTATVWARAL